MNRTIAPEITIAQKVTLPEVVTHRLKNGVMLYAINAGDQDVVKVELIYHAGKWYEQKNLIADVANRMLREGTAQNNAKQLADKFDYYGANFNTSAGFATAGASLYTLNKYIGRLLPLLSEVFHESVFPEHELKTIIDNRKQRLAVNMKKNDFLASRNFVSDLFGSEHPYGRVTEVEHLDAINTDDLKKFYQRYYHPANLSIMVSGKFDNELLKQIENAFGTEISTASKAEDNLQYAIKGRAEKEHRVSITDSVQTALAIGNLSIGKTHPDYLKLSVLNTTFGGYFGSRLMSNIREEKGYTYGIYSSLISYPHVAFIEIAAEVGKEVADNTLKEIQYEINRIRDEKIDDEELEVVKNYMSGKIMRSVDGPIRFSETLKSLLVFNQDVSEIQKYLDTINSVTADELQQLANKYYNFNDMTKVAVG